MDDNNIDDKKLLAELSQACDALMWLSESDYPWQVVSWRNEDKIDCQTLLQHYEYHPETKVSTKTLDSFFQNATTEQEWHDETEKAEVKRYQNLYSWLKNNLRDIQVFLVGEIEIDVYLLGRANQDKVVGLSTKMIQT